MNRFSKFGVLHNGVAQEGYTLHYLRTENRHAIYSFDLLYPNPLTWQNDVGFWQPNKKELETDLGSVPICMWPLVSPVDFPVPFIYHDSAWRKGGLWFSSRLEGPYEFYPMSLHAGNLILREILALDANIITRNLIYYAVEISAKYYKEPGSESGKGSGPGAALVNLADLQSNPNPESADTILE